MTEVEVHMPTYFRSTAGCPQAVQIRSRRWSRSLQVRAISIIITSEMQLMTLVQSLVRAYVDTLTVAVLAVGL